MIFRRHNFTVVFIFALVSLIVPAVSCSLYSDDKAFVSELDVVDALIAQGDVNGALKGLSLAEKKAFNSFSYLGIYRRYRQLGEYKNAERLILKALKKEPSNAELNAVRAHALLREGKLEDSFPFALKLLSTRYESLYSEALLQKRISELPAPTPNDFINASYIPVFRAAYETSKNTLWLKNCAVALIHDNKIKDAALLQPSQIYTAEDALFWGLVQYDSSRFMQAAQNFTLAQNLFFAASRKNPEISRARISALKSDALVCLGDYFSAQQEREFLLETVGFDAESGAGNKTDDFIAVTYVNSAFWAAQNGDDRLCYDMLFSAVRDFPDYIPGLAAYGRFAYKSSQPPKENFYENALRSSGVRTLRMQRYDASPRVSVSDALYRMDESVRRTHDPLLEVIRSDLRHRVEKTPENLCIAEAWQMLENSSRENALWPPVIVRYAVHILLSAAKISDAENLFFDYEEKRYSFDPSENSYLQLLSHKDDLDAWECEYGAYFAINKKFVDIARTLYEYVVSARPEYRTEELGDASFSAAINLAVIYSSTGAKQKALDLYGKKAGAAVDNVKKADILYRIACIQDKQKKNAEALRTLSYCISLDPLNEKARLLLLQLRTAK
ncbi:hypothetical protein HRQ91_09875 [Treponema parvum]|uniref:Tetratricopeptide repeat protein n=1 Tax=Treponema parvum TaxID=138851 RepID=A0A975IF45_9SPIR|nr:hypothetical protein [Treponema parvum]QTQ14745.1 hypothetical protein HRQ91_09875 [Treponema parvum]